MYIFYTWICFDSPLSEIKMLSTCSETQTTLHKEAFVNKQNKTTKNTESLSKINKSVETRYVCVYCNKNINTYILYAGELTKFCGKPKKIINSWRGYTIEYGWEKKRFKTKSFIYKVVGTSTRGTMILLLFSDVEVNWITWWCMWQIGVKTKKIWTTRVLCMYTEASSGIIKHGVEWYDYDVNWI